jgi:hypothetical protein
MQGSPERSFLEELERGLARGDASEPEAVLALIAGREVGLDPAEVRGAQRRGVQLLAAGGDPQRGLDLDGRAVLAVAEDLDTDERRRALAAGFERLSVGASGLPHVLDRVEALTANPDVAWRWFAVTVLAEELSPD